MIPLKDRSPTQRVPFVNIAIIILNIAVFLYQVSLGRGLEGFLYKFGVVPEAIVTSFNAFHLSPTIIFPVFSSMFLHGGWLHLGGNMLYLWVFGDNVEDKLGHVRYFIFYLLCGVAAWTAHILIDPHSTIPAIGASGAISGVLGAYLLMFPKARVLTLIPIFIFLQFAELPALVVLGFWFVMQFFNGLISLGYETAGIGGVAWWAHIGGFVAGTALVLPFKKFR